MKIFIRLYEKIYKRKAPNSFYRHGMLYILFKPIRKWLTNSLAADCPFNTIRILIYKICGFSIGKGCFIGMKCYLDDMYHSLIIIEDNVTISYGVYFACHGRNQEHLPIIIKNNAYIGTRATILSKNSQMPGSGITIGEHSIIGACTLVNKNIPPYATAVGIPCKISLS